MTILNITVGPYTFVAKMEAEKSPATCQAFQKLLPFRQKLIHARWSGEAGFVPLGEFDLGVRSEDPTSHPAPGELLFYPGGLSECEILVPYGNTCFASKAGQLAGSHFLTIVKGKNQFAEMGRSLLWDGALDVEFCLASSAQLE